MAEMVEELHQGRLWGGCSPGWWRGLLSRTAGGNATGPARPPLPKDSVLGMGPSSGSSRRRFVRKNSAFGSPEPRHAPCSATRYQSGVIFMGSRLLVFGALGL